MNAWMKAMHFISIMIIVICLALTIELVLFSAEIARKKHRNISFLSSLIFYFFWSFSI